MAFKMKGLSAFKKADPPKVENDNMAIMHMMIQDGADYKELQNFGNNGCNRKSNYSFNQERGEVGVHGEDGKFRKLDKKTFDSAAGGQYQGLWKKQ